MPALLITRYMPTKSQCYYQFRWEIKNESGVSCSCCALSKTKSSSSIPTKDHGNLPSNTNLDEDDRKLPWEELNVFREDREILRDEMTNAVDQFRESFAPLARTTQAVMDRLRSTEEEYQELQR
ncbi:hypothetical protein BM1_01244 [Bipolaris maydis]|uniref:uncharacterized protein n=1 Tax=Cochliobolus heterostrophus TaxID=5016 RepID=UPI0024D2383C|nr:hypothetical protein BM1_01244 [Bipolaris maydis]KAJ5026822.1 hypothetical protein J3E73DRAFT_369880 [Bipolaris maydis]KAJ6271570.1 hypothetical protein PSV08DRAFT_351158 [Bipolaris maydis]KAJ6282367.1 hypothetical protein J3E71DRAFT_341587 [Bipolaris maydis]